MTRPNGGNPEQARLRWRILGLASCSALLLTAAACVPGEGPRPPNRSILAGATGRPAPSAGTGTIDFGPQAGGGGIAPPAGRGGPSAGMGLPPAGQTGGGSGAGSGSIAGMIATAGRGPVMPDSGLPEFDGGSEPNRNMVQAGELCRRVSTLQCAGEAHCCPTPGRSIQECQSAMLQDCMKNAYLDDLAKNSITGFSPSQAKIALDRLEAAGANCDPGVARWVIEYDGLRGMYQGTVAPSQQCRPTGFLSVAGYGATLASCSQIQTHACLFTGNGPTAAPETATCAARAEAGATCFVDTNCKDGLYCANTQMKYSTGKCTVSKAVGAACSGGVECATQTCLAGKCAEPTVQSAWCLK